VHRLFKDGVGKKEISRLLGVRKQTIIGWLKRKDYRDSRGWKKNCKRTHTDLEEQRIITIKQSRVKGNYFVGAPYVLMDYNKQYSDETLPSEWFVKEVTRRAGLQTHEPKKRSKGQNIVSRLYFPIKSIIGLGKIHQSCDFIGKKYIRGQKEPINIFSTSFYQWFELYQIWRVFAETSEQAIKCLTNFWKIFPLPNVMRMDNGMTFRGTGKVAAHIGKFLKFILNLNIVPLFSSAHQSYTNPHIEGHNSSFTQKLWAKNFFSSVKEIDFECDRFNSESKEFFEWKFKERLLIHGMKCLTDKNIVDANILSSAKGKRICFIRFVERWKETNDIVGIVVLDRFVEVPQPYLNQYVFVTLNLETAKLIITSEHNGIVNEISNQIFKYTL